MTTNHDGFLPSWDQSWNIFDYDRFSEDGAIKNVTDGAVGTLPHLFQLELLYPCLVRSDSSTFYAYFVLLDGVSCIDCDLIVSGVTVLDAEVKVLDVYLQIRHYKFFFDDFPNDTGHLISIQFDNRVGYLYLLHDQLYKIYKCMTYDTAIL